MTLRLELPVFRLPFTAPMVLAVLCNRKTVTRRVWAHTHPLPQRGQRIAGTETFKTYQYANNMVGINYRAGKGGIGFGSESYLRELETEPGEAEAWAGTTNRWKPPMFMPSYFSRLPLIAADVRRELLGLGMTDADAIREGIYQVDGKWAFGDAVEERGYDTPLQAFVALWDFVNGPGAWHRDRHLEVVRIEFVRHDAPWTALSKEAS